MREGRSWLSREFEGQEIKIKDLSDVLKGVSLKISKGKFSAVVGGNGTGKSTMLKAVCDICRPYRGKILVDGKRVDKYKSAELFSGNLAMLPQDPQSLFVKKTVLEDLQEMLAGRVKDKAERERLIASVSEDCEITELLQTHPYYSTDTAHDPLCGKDCGWSEPLSGQSPDHLLHDGPFLSGI